MSVKSPRLLIIQNFTVKYPAVKKVKWNEKTSDIWEAKFKINGIDYSADFYEDGKWIETAHEIEKKEIPISVKSTLETQFSGYEIQKTQLFETKDFSHYEFVLGKGKEEIEVIVDPNNNIVKKKQID